jgi:glycosyltransferase involved in cell wall biosynthesis
MNLTDVELAWTYAHATAFVFPSLYEGFGLPILEAFANGCPVILSNRSCFPEIADEAALYFDPDAPGELETNLMRVVEDRQLRRELTDRARLRLTDFSWESSAEAHLRCYARAAGAHMR